MSCKIKGALLYDESFLSAFEEIRTQQKMPRKVAYRFFAVANEMGNEFKKLDTERQALIEKLAIKGNNGKPKVDKDGQFKFKEPKKVKELVITLLTKDIELKVEGVTSDEITEMGIVPALIQSLAIISPIFNK